MGEAKPVIFNTEEVAKVDKKVIQDLKQKAAARADKRFRLCLHRSGDDLVHEMIIVHGKGIYVRPHKHENQTSSIHIIEGEMVIVLFDEQGNQVDRFHMGERASGRCFVCRLEKGLWHTELFLAEPVVFLETMQGPFKPLTHSSFAPWSPEADDQAGIDRFMKSILG